MQSYLTEHLCEQLLQEGADEGSDFVSIKQVEIPFRVGAIVNDSVGIAIKGAATCAGVNLKAFTDRERCKTHFTLYTFSGQFISKLLAAETNKVGYQSPEINSTFGKCLFRIVLQKVLISLCGKLVGGVMWCR